jgi:hypothetical protein
MDVAEMEDMSQRAWEKAVTQVVAGFPKDAILPSDEQLALAGDLQKRVNFDLAMIRNFQAGRIGLGLTKGGDIRPVEPKGAN